MSVLFFTALNSAAASKCAKTVSNRANLFLDAEKSTIDDFPAYSKFRVSEVVPVVEAELTTYKARVKEITENPESPTFENTILALENFDEGESWAATYLMIRKSNFADEETMKAYSEVINEYTDFRTEYINNPKLFGRIEAIYKKRHNLGLVEDQIRLVKDKYFEFADGGINLNSVQREQFNVLSKRSSDLQKRFAENLNNYKKTQFVHVEDKRELMGVPKEYVDQFRAAAVERDLPGYYISAGSQIAGLVLEYGKDRSLRERVWRMLAGLGYRTHKNNRRLVSEIATLKHKIAQLLGFKNYSEKALKNSMAQKVEVVEEVIDDLGARVLPGVKKRRENLVAFIREREGVKNPMPWDISHWSRIYDREHYNYDEEEFRKYFTLEAVMPRMMSLVSKVFGIEIILRPDLEALSKDSLVYEVRKGGKRYSYVIFDLYARDDKDGGASHYGVKSRAVKARVRSTAISAIQANLNKPLEGELTKLTFSDMKTLFHEFGHAMHHSLSEARYESQSGTSVVRDFVELPSQFMENFLLEPDILKSLSSHFKTGEEVPDELVDAMYNSRQSKMGNMYLGHIQGIKLDFAWYKEPIGEVNDLFAFERDSLKDVLVTKLVRSRMALHSPVYSHIFGGGYSSFYYSYLWSKILDADAFAQFKKEGLYNQAVAKRWLEEVLSVGDSKDAMDAFVGFMGRKPDIKALLIRDGIVKEED